MVTFLTPTTPVPSGSFCLRIVVPDDTPWRSALFGALSLLTDVSSWEQNGLLTPEDTAQYLQAPVYEAITGGDWCMIGAIFPYASATPPPHTIECFGQTLSRSDFPKLYAALDPAFIDDSETFHLPNLINRFVIGADITDVGDYPVGGVGGEATVTLNTDQIPSHSHTDNGHIHTVGNSAPVVAVGPGEVPVLAPNPIPAATSSGNADIQATGGGQAHTNIPPYTALRWAIVYE